MLQLYFRNCCSESWHGYSQNQPIILLHKFYLDDMIVFSESVDDHTKHFIAVFDQLD